MGSKGELLCTLIAVSSAKTTGFGVPSSIPKWRATQDKIANSYIYIYIYIFEIGK